MASRAEPLRAIRLALPDPAAPQQPVLVDDEASVARGDLDGDLELRLPRQHRDDPPVDGPAEGPVAQTVSHRRPPARRLRPRPSPARVAPPPRRARPRRPARPRSG